MKTRRQRRSKASNPVFFSLNVFFLFLTFQERKKVEKTPPKSLIHFAICVDNTTRKNREIFIAVTLIRTIVSCR